MAFSVVKALGESLFSCMSQTGSVSYSHILEIQGKGEYERTSTIANNSAW